MEMFLKGLNYDISGKDLWICKSRDKMADGFKKASRHLWTAKRLYTKLICLPNCYKIQKFLMKNK